MLSRDFQAGEPVGFSQRFDQGKLVDTVTVTTRDGKAVSLLDTTLDELRLTPKSKTHQFTMPSLDVTVHLAGRGGSAVSLGNSSNSSLRFAKIGRANSDWPRYPVPFGPNETVWVESAPSSGYYVSDYTVVGHQNYESKI